MAPQVQTDIVEAPAAAKPHASRFFLRRPNRAVTSALGFVGLLLVLLLALSGIFDRATRSDMTSKVNWVFAKHGEQYDFAVLGSSRAYVTTDVSTLAETLGGRGINLGLDGAGYSELALLWERFLLHNTVRSRLLLEVDAYGLDLQWLSYPFHDYAYLPYLDESVVQRHLEDYFGWGRLIAWRWGPFYKYAEFNDMIGAGSLYRIATRARPEYDATGTFLIDLPFSDGAAAVQRTAGIDERADRALLRIVELAAARHLQVVLYSAPEFEDGDTHPVANLGAILGHYQALAAAQHVPLLMFDDPEFCADSRNFHDREHVNKRGALEFSALLGARVAGLPDSTALRTPNAATSQPHVAHGELR